MENVSHSFNTGSPRSRVETLANKYQVQSSSIEPTFWQWLPHYSSIPNVQLSLSLVAYRAWLWTFSSVEIFLADSWIPPGMKQHQLSSVTIQHGASSPSQTALRQQAKYCHVAPRLTYFIRLFGARTVLNCQNAEFMVGSLCHLLYSSYYLHIYAAILALRASFSLPTCLWQKLLKEETVQFSGLALQNALC